jgi:hypothetical protein
VCLCKHAPALNPGDLLRRLALVAATYDDAANAAQENTSPLSLEQPRRGEEPNHQSVLPTVSTTSSVLPSPITITPAQHSALNVPNIETTLDKPGVLNQSQTLPDAATVDPADPDPSQRPEGERSSKPSGCTECGLTFLPFNRIRHRCRGCG